MILNKEEREKFKTYLQRWADSDEALLNEMAKINAPQRLLDKRKNEIAAVRTVVALLESIEDA